MRCGAGTLLRREPVPTRSRRRSRRQRRATSSSASRCSYDYGNTTAACTRARAARALYTLQQGPRSTKRAPSTAIEFQRARLRVGKTAFTSTTMWRMFAARTGGPRALARSRRRARAAYGKQTNCCIGSTERLKRAPARALTLMTMDEDNCSCFFDELGRCNGL